MSIKIIVKTYCGSCSWNTEISENDWEQISDLEKKSHVREALRNLDVEIHAVDDNGKKVGFYEIT